MLSKSQLARHVRLHVERELFDESSVAREGAAADAAALDRAAVDKTAIYTLSDPRDIRLVRYVGQTASPRRRFTQHLNCARLWFADEQVWWIKSPQLRPLYEWIRALYREGRLPTMVVSDWVATPAAHLAERARIYDCLVRGLPLLNVERELLGPQWPLL